MFVRIEKAGTEYADIIGQVHSEAWQQAYAGVFPESFLMEDTAEKRKQEFLEAFGNNEVFYCVVYENVTPIGIVKVIEEPNAYEIASFYILEKYRNKGYGKQVIAYLQKELNPKRIRLWVLEENTKARRFYENNGFEFSGNTRLIHRGQAYTQLEYEFLQYAQYAQCAYHSNVILEQLTHENYKHACEINRDDIPEEWVDTAETIMDVNDYGLENNLIGHTFLARIDDQYIALIMVGEALPWDTDPVEMKDVPFYRLMGFVVDKEYRNKGLGGEIMEKAIQQVYQEFGRRSLALGVHKDNIQAGRFYERHGFKKMGVFEGDDEYYLRLI